MSKLRVYELARELKLESKALMNRLQSLGVEVQTHQSMITNEQVALVKKSLQEPQDSLDAKVSGSSKVIRRRRAEPSAEASDDKFQQVVTQMSPPLIETPYVVVESITATITPEPEEPEAQALVEAEQLSEVSIPIEQPVAPSEARAPSPPSVQTLPVSEAASRPPLRRPMVSGGATIVRRASAEELEAARIREIAKQQAVAAQGQDRRQQQQARPGPGVDKSVRAYRSGSARETESYGAHGSSFNAREAKEQRSSFDRSPAAPARNNFPPAAPVIPDIAVLDEDAESRRFKKKPVTSNEAEEQARKNLPAKTRRDNLNMRTLLSGIDEEDDSGVIPDGESEAPAARKTVYTPQSTRSRKDLRRRKDLKKTAITTPRAAYRVIKMGSEITVAELAKEMSLKSSEVIKKLINAGIMATINQTIDYDTATLVANEFRFEVQSNLVSVDDILQKGRGQEGVKAVRHARPAIVTIMGHVDHGKTSILDAIRKSKVAAGEAGGITQHIGAYTVSHHGDKITFLDTPGHEAFSAMRARGAKVTDIVILVVAADDGVMPQTREAISHAKNANVPIIVAVNKIDKPNINIDRVLTELTEFGIQSEEWGGDTQFIKLSALTGQGVEELLEAILLQAEILQLTSPIDTPAKGAVVEAHLDKGRGPVATVMVQEGTLRIGDYVVAGSTYGKVRSMTDHKGLRVESAEPSTPVEVIGLEDVPMAGDSVVAVVDEKMANEVAEMRREALRKATIVKSSAATLDELLSRIRTEEILEVPLIVKADTQGSLEAICESIGKLTTARVRSKVVHRAVGGITESEIMLATTTQSVVIAFNVRASRGLDDLAAKHNVPIKYFSIIYEIVDAVRALMAGKLPPIQKEVVIGHAEVRNPISIPKLGTIAGSSVMDGKITRASQLRLIRNDVVIYSGKIGSLRRFKDDVREVLQGYECGIGIDGYQDLREGDVIEAFVIEELAPTL